jgi:hypothetical protein
MLIRGRMCTAIRITIAAGNLPVQIGKGTADLDGICGFSYWGLSRGDLYLGSRAQGLKPSVFASFAARLKSCPDTKLGICAAWLLPEVLGLETGWSFSESQKAYLSG